MGKTSKYTHFPKEEEYISKRARFPVSRNIQKARLASPSCKLLVPPAPVTKFSSSGERPPSLPSEYGYQYRLVPSPTKLSPQKPAPKRLIKSESYRFSCGTNYPAVKFDKPAIFSADSNGKGKLKEETAATINGVDSISEISRDNCEDCLELSF